MSALFFDTSAVVKRYLQEVGSSWVRATTNPLAGGIIVIADLATVELFSLLARRVRERTLPASSATQLGNTFLLHSAQEYLTLDMGNTVLEAARFLVGRHPLPTLDALQLASAQRAVSLLGEPITFVSSDRNLLNAAAAEGFAVDDPLRHP